MIERADLSQYNTLHDANRFMALMATQGMPGFDTALDIETRYIDQQLKTDLGERLDLAVSRFEYEIRDGKLYEPGRNEPFEVSMAKGYEEGRKAVDFDRDKVEFQTWKTMQSVLASPDTPDGTIVLDFSPRGKTGTNYEDDYIDSHVKRGDKVESARYRSNLTTKECREKIVNLNPYYDYLPQNPTDVDIKTAPVILPPHMGHTDPDALVRSLIGEEVGISQEELDEVYVAVAALRVAYINTLIENPGALIEHEKNYRAFLNGSHKSHEQVKSRIAAQKFASYFKTEVAADFVQSPSLRWKGTKFEIDMLANEEIQIAGGSCGSSGSSCSNPLYAMEIENSVEDFYGKTKFTCPDCGYLNSRGYDELIANCQNDNCKSDKVLPPGLRGSKSVSN